MEVDVRILLAMAVLCASGAPVVWAAPLLPGLEVLWEHRYSYELWCGVLLGGWGSTTLDDFILEEPAVIMGFEGWFVAKDDSPEPFYAAIRHDDGGQPGDGLWNTVITDVTPTYTGDDYHGEFVDYGLYHYLLLLEEGDYIGLEAGRPYWLKLLCTNFPGYWACSEGGNAYAGGYILDLSLFFSVLGTPVEESVTPASWGEIKAGFVD
ncbi:MAG TPA: hypothetical protein ENN88_03180 [Candidatus Coatesbacteria bacterium]|nr:hypothetical protein [Candidatus Coatesbacteria bacterium]